MDIIEPEQDGAAPKPREALFAHAHVLANLLRPPETIRPDLPPEHAALLRRMARDLDRFRRGAPPPETAPPFDGPEDPRIAALTRRVEALERGTTSDATVAADALAPLRTLLEVLSVEMTRLRQAGGAVPDGVAPDGAAPNGGGPVPASRAEPPPRAGVDPLSALAPPPPASVPPPALAPAPPPAATPVPAEAAIAPVVPAPAVIAPPPAPEPTLPLDPAATSPPRHRASAGTVVLRLALGLGAAVVLAGGIMTVLAPHRVAWLRFPRPAPNLPTPPRPARPATARAVPPAVVHPAVVHPVPEHAAVAHPSPPAPKTPAPPRSAPDHPTPAHASASVPAAPPVAAAAPSGTPPATPKPVTAHPAVAPPPAAVAPPHPPAPVPVVVTAPEASAPASAPATHPVTPPAGPASAAAPRPAPAIIVPKPTVSPKPAAPPAPPIAIRAIADTWVSLLDAQGHTVLARLLHAGDTLVPPAPGLTLTTGNAGGTELVVNGHAGPPLGATGVVLHAVKLTPPPG